MANYINRDAVLVKIWKCESITQEAEDELVKAIESIPTADVRPVVYCRECKFSYENVGGRCCSHGVCVDCIVQDDFYCADGERREGGADG